MAAQPSLLGPHLTEIWKQPVVVDNRGGAGGNIGADAVAKAPPDGYTLLLGNAGPITINPSLHKKMPYDAQRDLLPIAMLSGSPMVLVAHPSLPVKTVKEFVALAKAKPDTLNYSSAGIGSSSHLAPELLAMIAAGLFVAWRGTLPIPVSGTGGPACHVQHHS